MTAPQIAVMVITEGVADQVMITCATLEGHVWTRPAKDPSVMEAIETLIELVSARAPASGAVLVHPGQLDFAEVHLRAAALGWRHGSTTDANSSGWSRVWRPGEPKVVICDRARADTNHLFHRRADDDATATALAAFHKAVGVPWYSTGALTGVIALTETWDAKHKPHWHTRVPDHIPASAELHWAHPHYDQLADHADQLAVWDGRKFGLNAMAGLRVAMSGLSYVKHDEYLPEVPGYWNIDAEQVTRQVTGIFGETFPPVIADDEIVGGRAWLTNQRMDLITKDWDMDVSVYGAQVSPTSWAGFPLRPLAHRLRDTIYAGVDDELGEALKEVYARVPSMIGAAGGSCARRDWRDTHEDFMTASMLRRVRRVQVKTGLLPLRIERDAITYAIPSGTDLGALAVALGEGDLIGNMRRVE